MQQLSNPPPGEPLPTAFEATATGAAALLNIISSHHAAGGWAAQSLSDA